MKTIKYFPIILLAAMAAMFLSSCDETPGCTDPLSLNYDPTADTDDGSCTYPTPGCTDSLSLNYDPTADTDDGSCIYAVTPGFSKLTFKFEHNFNSDVVSAATFNAFSYVTEDGDTLSLTKLRYLISDIRLYTADGDSVVIEDYQLVDVANGTGLNFAPDDEIPHGVYTGISFIFGFDEADNIEDAYPDLNIATWNWPDMLGGGYHFMQMEGMFRDQGVNKPYAYHNGTARVSEGVFEQNYFKADLEGTILDKQFGEISIVMDIAEWYRNPHVWDLNTLSIMLMPNYTAQKMMHDNGKTVFSLGTVTQTN